MVGAGGEQSVQLFNNHRGEREERRTWVEMPLVVLCSRRQRQRHGQHSDGEEPRGWNSHDSSNTPGYLSGEARTTTGIPGEKKNKNKNRCELRLFASISLGSTFMRSFWDTQIFIEITIKVNSRLKHLLEASSDTGLNLTFNRCCKIRQRLFKSDVLEQRSI